MRAVTDEPLSYIRTLFGTTSDDPDALFREARRRRRRRRAVAAGFAVLALLVSGLVVLANRGSGSGGHFTGPGSSHSGEPSRDGTTTGLRPVRIVALPTNYYFNEVMATAKGLLLMGSMAPTKAHAPCVAATVNPLTLRVGPVTKGNCDDPALSGRSVIAVNSYLSDNNAAISIATLNPTTKAFSVSPVVMTYQYDSTSRPVIAYGGHSMWVYDAGTTAGSEAMQISATTGQLISTVATPLLFKPILAANDDGLFLGNTIEGGTLSDPLWHIAPAATHAVPVGPSGSDLHVSWLVGSGDDLWAGITSDYVRQSIWRFDGTASTVGFHVSDGGYFPLGVVGNATDGLWTAVPYPPLGPQISPRDNRRQDVIRIDPISGEETVDAHLRPASTLTAELGLVEGQAAVVNGYFFALQPPFSANGYLGYRYLVRVGG